MRRKLLLTVGGIVAADRLASWLLARHDRERFPPPGDLIDVGGHRLHLHRIGSGGPAVVVETGWGAPSFAWRAVADELSSRTTVCLYDRAGYGWSESGPGPRDGRRIADELAKLLERAGVPGPYVLVGHSIGAVYARTFVARHRALVAGLVFVDAAHEDQFRELHTALGWRASAPQAAMIGMAGIAPLGLVRAGIEWGALSGMADKLFDAPEEERELLVALSLTSRLRRALLGEALRFADTGREVRHAGSLGDLPLQVLTASRSPEGVGTTDEERERARVVWLDLQRRLAALSTRGEHVMVDHSGHFIHRDRPDAVVAAIEKVLATVS